MIERSALNYHMERSPHTWEFFTDSLFPGKLKRSGEEKPIFSLSYDVKDHIYSKSKYV